MSVALITQPVFERGGEGSRIVGRDQLAGTGAIRGAAERFGQPAHRGRYDGYAVGKRFGDGHSVALRGGWRGEQVGSAVRVGESCAGQDAGKPDAVAVTELVNASQQLFDEIRIAVERTGKRAVPVEVTQLGKRLDENVLSL